MTGEGVCWSGKFLTIAYILLFNIIIFIAIIIIVIILLLLLLVVVFLAVKHFTANVVAKNYKQSVIERGCHWNVIIV